MKKLLIIGVVLSLLFAPGLGEEVQALENIEPEFDLYGNFIYTTFADDDLVISEDINGETFNIDLSSALGFGIGGEVNITPEISASAEYVRFSTSDSESFSEELNNDEPIPQQVFQANIDFKMVVNAIRGNFVYDISSMIEEEEVPAIKLKAGAGYYFGGLDIEFQVTEDGEVVDEFSEREDFDGGFGFRIGAEIEQEIMEDLSIRGDIGYRILDLTVEDENFDLNGIEIGAGLSYSF